MRTQGTFFQIWGRLIQLLEALAPTQTEASVQGQQMAKVRQGQSYDPFADPSALMEKEPKGRHGPEPAAALLHECGQRRHEHRVRWYVRDAPLTLFDGLFLKKTKEATTFPHASSGILSDLY